MHVDAPELPSHLGQHPSLLAALDAEGTVLAVNEAWRVSARTHGMTLPAYGVGASYPAECERAAAAGVAEAGRIAAGIREVAAGLRSVLRVTYTCERPQGRFYYNAQVRPFTGLPGAACLVQHDDVTERVSAELETDSGAMHWLQGMLGLNEAILDSLDAETILDRMARLLVDEGLLRSVMLALVDHEAGTVEVVQRLHWNAVLGRFEQVVDSAPLTYHLENDSVTPTCARTGNTIVIDSDADPRPDARVPEDRGGQDAKLACFIPIRHRDRVMAVLATGATPIERHEVLRNIEALRPLLTTVAIALRHARLHADLRRRNGLIATFQAMAADVVSDLDADEILLRLGRRVVEAGVFRSLAMGIVDQESGVLRQVPHGIRLDASGKAAVVEAPEQGRVLRLDRTHPMCEVARTGEIVIIEGPEDSLVRQDVDKIDDSWDDKVACYFPVKAEGRVLAVLATASTRADRPRMEQALELIQPLLGQVAIALQHARLHADLQRAHGHTLQQTRLMEAFQAMAGDVLARLDADEILLRLSIKLVETGAVQGLALARVDHEEGVVRDLDRAALVTPEGVAEVVKAADAGRVQPLDGKDIMCQVARTGELTVIDRGDDPRLDQEILRRRVPIWGDRVAYFFAASAGDRVEAVLAASSESADRARVLQTIEALQPLLSQVAIALQHADLYQQLRTSRDALDRSERTFDAVFDSTSLSMFFVDGEGRILKANPAFHRYLGYEAGGLAGRSVASLTASDSLDETESFLDDGSADRTEDDAVEKAYLRRDGSPVWARVRAMWMTTSEGGRQGFAVVEDITEERARQREAMRLERLRAQTTLAAGISHNLNNLLTGITVPVQILQMADLPETAKKELGHVLHAANSAAALVRRLHDSARGGAGEATLEPVGVAEVVADAVEAARPRWQDEASAAGLKIHIVQEVDALPPVQATRVELYDAVLNLLINAVDALPEGGRILIAGARRSAQEVELRVTDDGVGMDEDTRQHAFEAFYTRKVDVGTGLGLATVRAAVERWGGGVDIDSEPGVGTTVRLRLPTTAAAPTGSEATPVGQAPSLDVLVVEDEAHLRRALARALEAHRLQSAATAEEGLRHAAEHSFHVALIDLGLPDMPGDRLAERLRAQQPDLKLILLSGWILEEDDPRRRPFDAYLSKPMELSSLEAALVEVVGR